MAVGPLPAPGAGSRPLVANKAQRLAMLQAIEKERNSRVLAYVTADRQILPTQIASDVIPLFYEHLEKIGTTDRIDLFLYTRGGNTLTPNRLVHLIREYCKSFNVLVPFRAHSAGTTLALGANEIVMGPLGELGPTDPSVSNQFNPDGEAPKKDGKKPKVSISVEDVTAYLLLVKEKAGLDTPETMAQALRALTDQIHPLALGNVHRQYQLIRTISRRLLSLHLDPDKEGSRIEKIVDLLTEKLFSHGYEISRYEAKEIIGLPVTYASKTLEPLLLGVLGHYSKDIPIGAVNPNGNFVLDGGVIESSALTHSFVFEGLASVTKDGMNVEVKQQAWRIL